MLCDWFSEIKVLYNSHTVPSLAEAIVQLEMYLGRALGGSHVLQLYTHRVRL